MAFSIFRVLEEINHIQEQLLPLHAKSKEIDVVDMNIDFPDKAILIKAARECFRKATVEPAEFLHIVHRCATLLANYDTFRETYSDMDGETLEAIIDATDDVAAGQLSHTVSEKAEDVRQRWHASFPHGGYREVTALIDTIQNKYLVPFKIDRSLEPELEARISRIMKAH
ncbi:MAG: hypothetical protein LUC93_10355 [Planctomycetaceae bacterium]|nr:hypothetical protein [Planctomycetaceae bacterium]